jgi:hypothetical protein
MGDATAEVEPLGREFADALGRKDFDTIAGLLDATIDFRALTPNRFWEASDPAALIDEVLRQWFDDSKQVEHIDSIEADSIADRHRVAYRFRGHNADGPFAIEQQVYYTAQDGRINWMRVLCSGFRPG